MGLVTVLGMFLPPWYEEFAAPARAWYYTTSGLMLSHTPVWIILTYGGCTFALATMAMEFYRPRDWRRVVLAGIFTGTGIMFSGLIIQPAKTNRLSGFKLSQHETLNLKLEPKFSNRPTTYCVSVIFLSPRG